MPADDVRERKKRSKKKTEPEPTAAPVETNPMMRFLGVGLILAGLILLATLLAKELTR